MAFVNTHRMARISPTKVRPVVNMIRGKTVDEAISILELSHRRGASMVRLALLHQKNFAK